MFTKTMKREEIGPVMKALKDEFMRQLEALGPRALSKKACEDMGAGFSDGLRSMLLQLERDGYLHVDRSDAPGAASAVEPKSEPMAEPTGSARAVDTKTGAEVKSLDLHRRFEPAREGQRSQGRRGHARVQRERVRLGGAVMAGVAYDVKTDAVVYGEATVHFTREDWTRAALDQAGVTPRQLADADRHGNGKIDRVLRYRVTFELLVPADQEDGKPPKVGPEFADEVESAVTTEIDDALSAGELGSGVVLVDDAQSFSAVFIG